MYEAELGILSHFKIDKKPVSVEPITYGNINRTFKVMAESSDIPAYILQNVNVNVFKKPYELMDNVNGVCEHLKKKVTAAGGNPEVESMTFMAAENGSFLYVDESGKYWRLCRYIDGISYQSISRPELFHNAAVAFGNFSKQLADYPADTLHETIPNFHNTVSRYSDFKAAVLGCKNESRLAECKDECLFLESREPLSHIAVDAIKFGKMPLRVTHNDTKLNNVMMSATTDKGLCVIDLDTVMPGSVLYDFGDAIRFGACTTAEDDPDTSKIALDLNLFEQFTKGYIKGTGGALTECEYSLLPEGALLMTYELCLRFLGDYLNGDVYFKLNYENHNLVRARAQIALLKDMEKKLDDMKRIVADCRK